MKLEKITLYLLPKIYVWITSLIKYDKRVRFYKEEILIFWARIVCTEI